MKRYAIFVFYDYNAGGGWNDFFDSVDDLDAATNTANEESLENGMSAQVIDLHTGEIMVEF